jgi:hypothetical protein
MRLRLNVLLPLALLLSVGAWAQNSLLTGTWKMNLAKSKFNPGPPPKSPTIAKIEAVEGGTKIVTDGVNAEGQKTHSEVTITFDGKRDFRTATVNGKPDETTYEFMSVVKMDDHNYDVYELLSGGARFGTLHWTISPDGKTRTVTGTGTDAQGKPTNNVTVWDKQ